MKRIVKILSAAGIAILLFSLVFISAANAKSVYNTTMSVKTAAYVYTRKIATAPYRAAYLTYGEEFTVLDLTNEWATIIYGGKTRYIKSKNIEYKKIQILKDNAEICSKAADCTSRTRLGYSNCGNIAYDLGLVTSGGKQYRRCLFPTTYTASGKVKSKNVVGYLPSYFTTEKSVFKIVNGGTKLYSYAYRDSSASYKKKVAATVKTGTRVKYISENSTWAKIEYNNKLYFISRRKLSDYTLRAKQGKTVMRADVMPDSNVIKNIYWNAKITVYKTFRVNGYDCHLCEYDGVVGFVPEGDEYFGSNDTRYTKCATTIYKNSSESSGTACKLHADTTVQTGYSNGTWVKTTYDGTSGYMLASKLGQRRYKINATYYKNGYRLYTNKPAGTYTGYVSLVALKPSYYAYVKTDAGEYMYVKAWALQNTSYGITMYTLSPYTTLHTSASNSSSSIRIPYMTRVTYYKDAGVSSSGTWIKLSYNGRTYYLWQRSGDDMLSLNKSSMVYSSSNEIKQAIIDKAMYIYRLPTKYEAGADSGVPDFNGYYHFSNGGFVSYVLESAMTQYIPPYNLSADVNKLMKTGSIANKGFNNELKAATVSLPNILPGDVIFFNTASGSSASKANQCGIYLGDNEFIQCTSPNGVHIMPLKGVFASSIVKIRRFVPTTVYPAEQTVGLLSDRTNVYRTKQSGVTPLSTLNRFSTVTVLYTDSNNWAYVRYGYNSYGFVLTKYLDF